MHLEAVLHNEGNPTLRFLDTEKEYVAFSDHTRPMYPLATFPYEAYPAFRNAEFTGYKNKKFVDEFTEREIPLDGSLYMYRIDKPEVFEGYRVFTDTLRVFLGEDILKVCDYDPRARSSHRWIIVTEHQMKQIRAFTHMYGAREYITFSHMLAPLVEEVK